MIRHRRKFVTLNLRWNIGTFWDRKLFGNRLENVFFTSVCICSACRRCQNGFYEDCFNEGCLFADGIERGLLTVNRQMPGPAIHVSFL